MNIDPSCWRRCNTCKTDIGFGKKYFVCNVSTCNRKRTGLAFCSVECWDAHLPTARHRKAADFPAHRGVYRPYQDRRAEAHADDKDPPRPRQQP